MAACTLRVMSVSPMQSRPGDLTRRSLLGKSLGAAAGLLLAGCGGNTEAVTTVSPTDGTPLGGVSGLSGVSVEVWRDPG